MIPYTCRAPCTGSALLCREIEGPRALRKGSGVQAAAAVMHGGGSGVQAAAAAVMHGRASDAVPWESAAAFIGQAVWFKVI